MPLKMLARFPFLEDTRQHILEHGPDLRQLLTDIAYQRARNRGLERVEDALKRGRLEPFIGASKADCTLEMLSYPIARMLVSSINDSFLIKRYALAEGVKLKEELEQANPLPQEVFDELDMPVERVDERYRMHFSTYVPLAGPLRSKEWKLSNAPLKGGYVLLEKRKVARLAQAALQKRIEGELPIRLPEELEKHIGGMAAKVRSSLAEAKKLSPDSSVGRLTVAYMPPCIRKLISMAQHGENISHTGRFALATFLHSVGASNDDILKMFSASPDFDENLARYQIDHVTGVTSGTEYSPPECRTMQSNANCYEPDTLCKQEWMTHPLKYYRTKQRDAAKRRKAKEGKKGEERRKGKDVKGGSDAPKRPA